MSREVANASHQPISSLGDLTQIFEKGAREASLFRIGLETEKIGVYKETRRAVEFDGPSGIEAILKALTKNGWKETFDNGRLIALNQGTAAITLEPGEQLELSGAAVKSVDEVDQELQRHLREVAAVSDPLGVEWIHLGLQPVTPLAEMTWVPKSRYQIMRRYFEKHSPGGLEMMALTAAIQVNLDYSSESDAKRKVRVGAALGPVVAAMMANSPVDGGKLNGFCTRRMAIWQKTDPDRCGIRRFFVDGSFSFEKYRDYALDVPMYFTFRGGVYVDHTHHTFREFLKTSPGEATLGDWESHLTTLFPDVRLKNHLEFRTADANSPPLTLALTAFWIGICHDSDTLLEVEKRISKFSFEELTQAMQAVALHALQAQLGREPILQVARDVVSLAAAGLARLDKKTNRDELRYLGPLRALVKEGRSAAEVTRATWKGIP